MRRDGGLDTPEPPAAKRSFFLLLYLLMLATTSVVGLVNDFDFGWSGRPPMLFLLLPFKDDDEVEDDPSAMPQGDSSSSRILKNENDFSLENWDISFCILADDGVELGESPLVTLPWLLSFALGDDKDSAPLAVMVA